MDFQRFINDVKSEFDESKDNGLSKQFVDLLLAPIANEMNAHPLDVGYVASKSFVEILEKGILPKSDATAVMYVLGVIMLKSGERW